MLHEFKKFAFGGTSSIWPWAGSSASHSVPGCARGDARS
jgi:hypothetical protein